MGLYLDEELMYKIHAKEKLSKFYNRHHLFLLNGVILELLTIYHSFSEIRDIFVSQSLKLSHVLVVLQHA